MKTLESRGGVMVYVYGGPDRCEVTFDFVEGHAYSGVKGAPGQWASARCGRRGALVLVNRANEKHRFCGAHARLAHDGLVSARGEAVPTLDRRDIRRCGMQAPHAGEWSDDRGGAV